MLNASFGVHHVIRRWRRTLRRRPSLAQQPQSPAGAAPPVSEPHPAAAAAKPAGDAADGGPSETGTEAMVTNVRVEEGSSKDEKFRAFDKKTGQVLWETTLPAGGYASPATYEVAGKQYVVIAAGGGKMGTKSGDAYIAFALPD